MNEKPKTKSGWRILRRILLALAILATLIAILYAEENWRGKRDWENYKHKLEAKGEKFDWQAFVPPTVPDDQNFFCETIFSNIQSGKVAMSLDDSKIDFSSHKNLPKDKIGYLGAEGRIQFTDLQIWQNYYRNHPELKFPIAPQPQTPAKDVLLALSKFDLEVEELRQASERPFANVPLNYEDGFNSVNQLLPILADLKRCTRVLELRAVAELADGQNEKAVADIKLILYLNNSLRNSPFLISQLVRIAIVAIDLQPIWEGLAKHEWSDAQLAALDDELSKLDFLADYEFSMRGERAFAIGEFENQRRTREMISSTEKGYVTNKLTFMPGAYFYQNELAFARLNQELFLPIVDTHSRTVSPEALRHADAVINEEKKHLYFAPYKVQALMAMPALGTFAVKVAAIQSSVDLARIACALERYHLANGNYPETLDALAPKFIQKIPYDIIGGEPLHYRRTNDGQFVLYSVGWNEKDDGGKVVLRKGGSVDRDNGDWVWQYPKNN